MAFDINNNYTGVFYGKDRLGFTTPDADSSDWLRPWIPTAYPAPWLPGKRRDEGHPVGAQVVISSHQLVGLDKNGLLVPAGLFSGQQAAIGSGGQYCVIQYGADDVGFAYNPQTGALVSSATEYAVLAAPSDASTGDTITLPGQTGFNPTQNDIDFAQSCDLIPGGVARPIGYIVRNAFQFLGGVTVNHTSGGMDYSVESVIPVKFRVHNYMHEPATAFQTKFVLRVPWIGETPTTIQTLATNDGLSTFTQSSFSRSFVHCVGDKAAGDGKLYAGCSVVASRAGNGTDAGNFQPYNSSLHTYADIAGKVIGIEAIYPIKDYADRVRTQFERMPSFVGPFRETNPVQGLMGGSSTRGVDYAISLSTNAAFRAAKDAGTTLHEEFFTYVLIHVSC